MDWNKRQPETLEDNVFHAIGESWMLITAGTLEHYNTMTASWGALGVLWSRKVSFCFIRPSRYTREFMERSERYTLSFFPGQYHDALSWCGSHSGRTGTKAEAAGLTPCTMPGDTVSFEQARLVLVCRKLYHQDLDPARFLDASIAEHYPDRDYHRMYVGEIEECLSR